MEKNIQLNVSCWARIWQNLTGYLSSLNLDLFEKQIAIQVEQDKPWVITWNFIFNMLLFNDGAQVYDSNNKINTTITVTLK